MAQEKILSLDLDFNNQELDLEFNNNNNNIIELLDFLIDKAVKFRASDIHVEPFEFFLRIRFRIDGVLHEIYKLDLELHENLISRIKIISNLDISEKRLPQDGNFKFNKNINIRVSIINNIFGEKAVLRLIYACDLRFDLDKNNLGFFKEDLDKLNNLFNNKNHGAIIITGPTGSGKTTSLNAFIKDLNHKEKNIITLEDPVENFIYGVNQININPKINFDFDNALRAILRQDPDIIMLGEIRDSSSAQIAMRAAITGHLVLTSLHTNNSISAISRLLDLNIKNYILAQALELIISQRLVRRLCPECKKIINIKKSDAGFLNLEYNTKIYEPVGCESCNYFGYKGRLALYEYFILDNKIKSMIESKDFKINKLKNYLTREINYKTLFDCAKRNLLLGNTSLDEIYKNIFCEADLN